VGSLAGVHGTAFLVAAFGKSFAAARHSDAIKTREDSMLLSKHDGTSTPVRVVLRSITGNGVEFLPKEGQISPRLAPIRNRKASNSWIWRRHMEIKYENVTNVAFHLTKGEAVVLVVLNGNDGTGYSIRAESGLRELLPAILRKAAMKISMDNSPSPMGAMDSISDS
jgi:hypothetical protein